MRAGPCTMAALSGRSRALVSRIAARESMAGGPPFQCSAGGGRERPQDVMDCHVLSCSVMAAGRGPGRFRRCGGSSSGIAFLLPFDGFRRARQPGQRPCFARIARVRVRARQRARYAAARIARLIARARGRRAQLSRPFPPGLFSAPAARCRAKERAAPEAALTPAPLYRAFPGVKPPARRPSGSPPGRAGTGAATRRQAPYS